MIALLIIIPILIISFLTILKLKRRSIPIGIPLLRGLEFKPRCYGLVPGTHLAPQSLRIE